MVDAPSGKEDSLCGNLPIEGPPFDDSDDDQYQAVQLVRPASSGTHGLRTPALASVLRSATTSVPPHEEASSSMESEVRFLRWPHEYDKRTECQTNRTPCLWIVEASNEPPPCTDPLEDWVRPPLSKSDIAARVATLLQRVHCERVPMVAQNNVLHAGGRHLAMSDAETAVMVPLIENFQSVVSRTKLARRAWGSDGQDRRNALDLRILRLRRRIKPLSLEITTVWGRGYMLEAA